jgi:hypothetical protein
MDWNPTRKIRKARFWIEMLALTGAAICAFALFSAPPAVRGGAAGQLSASSAGLSSSGEMHAYEGMITDTRCGAKHSATIGLAASNCVTVCVHGGEGFALVDGDTVYALDGETAELKRAAGQRVRIIGSVRGNRIAVASVSIN